MAAGLLFAAAAAVGRTVTGDPSGGAVRDVNATLYLQNCASCHGAQGEGTANGPSLIGVGAAAADFYLRTGRMPLGAPDQRAIRQEPRFSQQEMSALVAYIGSLGSGPAIPQVTNGGDVHRGWELYTANCAACHGASGSGNAVGGGFAAACWDKASSLDVAEAMLIGPGVMPPFRFEPADRDAIVAYVEYLRHVTDPGRDLDRRVRTRGGFAIVVAGRARGAPGGARRSAPASPAAGRRRIRPGRRSRTGPRRAVGASVTTLPDERGSNAASPSCSGCRHWPAWRFSSSTRSVARRRSRDCS